jgi:hypothetical protein
VIPEISQQRCLAERLWGCAANAANSNERSQSCAVGLIHFLAGEREHRFKKTDLRIANRELRRVDADGEPSGSGGGVIARQRALMPFVEAAVCIKRKGMRRNDETCRQRLSQSLDFH